MTIGISVYPGLDSRKSLEASVALAIKENLKHLFYHSISPRQIKQPSPKIWSTSYP